jgi:hypothetical protein
MLAGTCALLAAGFTAAHGERSDGAKAAKAREAGAYLQITLTVNEADRPAAGNVYATYKQPFLDTVPGALSKSLLIRDEDVQVLHGFETVEQAQAYLNTDLFASDIVDGLTPVLQADPEVRIYAVP